MSNFGGDRAVPTSNPIVFEVDTSGSSHSLNTSFLLFFFFFLEERGREGVKEGGGEREKEKRHAAISVAFSNPDLVQEFNYTYFHHFFYSDILIKVALIQFL